MTVDKEYCFDPDTQTNCNQNPGALLRGRTVFFAVQPRYLNVDIRITIDVTLGGTALIQRHFGSIKKVCYDPSWYFAGEKYINVLEMLLIFKLNGSLFQLQMCISHQVRRLSQSMFRIWAYMLWSSTLNSPLRPQHCSQDSDPGGAYLTPPPTPPTLT